ncbi:MAG: diguanylate phosphodiesterase [Colwelliaceae bacterium]|nr:diguanylate phosphodiesterase [Colwelliaceae bacterium]
MEDKLNPILQSLNCVAFQYHADGYFHNVFIDLPWAQDLIPNIESRPYQTLTGHSFFLDDFIRDAISFWQSQSSHLNNEKLDSGIWTEHLENKDAMHLSAEAINHPNGQFLIIKNLAHEFEEKQNTLQAAREMLIANENVVASHQYAQERVASISNEQASLQRIVEAISKAVDTINTGILIVDSEMNCLMDNPAIKQLFNLTVESNKDSILTIILQLLEKQYPEFNQILSSDETWQGELCWMLPPFNMKWFMLSIIPIRSPLGKLNQWVFITSDISRLKHLQQQNEKLTLIDNLTELPNRQYFWNALETLIAAAIPCYIVYIDIENFKRINDELGHAKGDEVLSYVSEHIRKSVKREDVVARIGGNEFGVLLQGVASDEQCKYVLDRVGSIALTSHFQRMTNNLGNSLNLGIAAFPRDGNNVERLLKSVGIAVKQAKDKLELNHCFYNSEMEQEALRQLKLKQELESALELQQFELYFQPIYLSHDKKISKVEVLIRWNHPELGLVMPGSFIPLAEASGLIVPMGKWIIEQACQALGELAFQGHHLGISINLSPRQFNDKSIAPFIEETIKNFNIDPAQIELEVTEGLLIYNYDAVLEQLKTLRKVGIKLSVDDFGTGYSSLSYLKRLPIDSLKIDRSFVTDLAVDENDKAIVSAVIVMAHQLKLLVVAEGVEEENQLDFLIQHDCDFIQGYLLCRPLPFEKLCDVLAQQ